MIARIFYTMTRSMFGHIRRLGENRYRVYWRKDGEPMSRVVRGTRDDAEMFLARMRLGGSSPDVTWRQFWMASVEPTFGDLAVKTREEYYRLWRVELEPRIGTERVADMDWSRANDVLTSIHAPSVQRSAGRLLKKMCNMAIRDSSHLLSYNPVDRAIGYAPHRKRQKQLVDSFAVRGFMDAVRGLKYEPVLLCELGAGLRPEEACALLWEDVSEIELRGAAYAVLSVDKALVTTGSGKHLKDTKNEPSSRDAVMGEPFASRLLELADGKTGPLCPSGAPWDASRPESWYTSPATVTHNWRSWCGSHGIPYTTQENLRSSYATIMGEAGAEDSVVSGNMGHSDGTTKGRNYQSITTVAKCRAADKLASWLDELHDVACDCA